VTFSIQKVGHCVGSEENGKEDPGEDILSLARRTKLDEVGSLVVCRKLGSCNLRKERNVKRGRL
jgi:hypothetical protein